MTTTADFKQLCLGKVSFGGCDYIAILHSPNPINADDKTKEVFREHLQKVLEAREEVSGSLLNRVGSEGFAFAGGGQAHTEKTQRAWNAFLYLTQNPEQAPFVASTQVHLVKSDLTKDAESVLLRTIYRRNQEGQDKITVKNELERVVLLKHGYNSLSKGIMKQSELTQLCAEVFQFSNRVPSDDTITSS